MKVELKVIPSPPQEVIITMTKEEASQLMLLLGSMTLGDKERLMQLNNTKYDPLDIGNEDWSYRLYWTLSNTIIVTQKI